METHNKPSTRGERIKKLREAKKLTQEQLADRVNVTKAAVSKWEATASPNIELVTFFLLAHVLEVDPEQLATGEQRLKRTPKALTRNQQQIVGLYDRLPEEARFTALTVVQALAAVHSESYAQWSKTQGVAAEIRDSKAKVTT